MRLHSTDKTDIGYAQFVQLHMVDRKRIKVMFNGEDVTSRCYMADDELGIVELVKTDQGKLMVLKDEIQTETLSGQVVIEVTDDP